MSCGILSIFILVFILPSSDAAMKQKEHVYNITSGSDIWQCRECPPGHYRDKDCLPGEMNSTKCRRCRDGRFMPIWNSFHGCKECRPCQGENQITKEKCSNTHDNICGCAEGFYHEHNSSDTNCIAFRVCGRGYGVKIPGTEHSDVECIRCVLGRNFSDVESSYESCRNCTDCMGVTVLEPCRLYSDSVCDRTTVPSTVSTTNNPSEAEGGTSQPVSSDGNNYLPLYITVGVLAFIVFIGIVVALVLYRRYRSKKQTHGTNSPTSAQGTAIEMEEMMPNNGRLHEDGMRNGCSGAQRAYRRHVSFDNLELKPGENIRGVLNYIARHYQRDNHPFLLDLPGDHLNQADLENIAHDCDERRNPANFVIQCLLMWRERNTDEDGAALAKLFEKLSVHNHDLSIEIKGVFFQPRECTGS